MIAIGLGCRKGAAVEDVEAVIRDALAASGRAGLHPDCLATEAGKASEPGLRHAAERAGFALVAVSREALASVTHLVRTRSARVEAEKGVPSIAEAAALAAVGRNPRLIVARCANATATAALAEGDGP